MGKPFYVQDSVHVATKMRNRIFITMTDGEKLQFGEKYFIRFDHLDFLVKNFTKDQHQLTPSVLNSMDRMNFSSVLRMCDDRVINMLKEHVKDSKGTITYLEMIRDIVASYRNKELSPLERITKIWYSVFICRLWREYVESKPHLSVEHNFLTSNCYSCIELNAHSMILIMLYLKEKKMPQLFRPEFFESQPCEQMFRQIRSFTSTYSTVVNCSIKEIVERINKIQLQSDIAFSLDDFEFPRVKTLEQDAQKHTTHPLPSKEDIRREIEKCRSKAIKFAIEIGLRDSKNSHKPVHCGVKEIRANKWYDVECEIGNEEEKADQDQVIVPGQIKLKDFSHKFENRPEETSLYVEVFCGRNARRMVVKKSSLVWLLRGDTYKLSSDRLQRVKSDLLRKKKMVASLKVKRTTRFKRTMRKNY